MAVYLHFFDSFWTFFFFLMLYHDSILFIPQNKNHSYMFLPNHFMVSVLQSPQSKFH